MEERQALRASVRANSEHGLDARKWVEWTRGKGSPFRLVRRFPFAEVVLEPGAESSIDPHAIDEFLGPTAKFLRQAIALASLLFSTRLMSSEASASLAAQASANATLPTDKHVRHSLRVLAPQREAARDGLRQLQSARAAWLRGDTRSAELHYDLALSRLAQAGTSRVLPSAMRDAEKGRKFPPKRAKGSHTQTTAYLWRLEERYPRRTVKDLLELVSQDARGDRSTKNGEGRQGCPFSLAEGEVVDAIGKPLTIQRFRSMVEHARRARRRAQS